MLFRSVADYADIHSEALYYVPNGKSHEVWALTVTIYGFAVQKGNKELLDKINAGLKNIKDDGTYDKLIDEWFNK